ncbi:class I SAM-dependent methyltransferase [Arthrobacter sp. CAN_A1]|uniref:class I SAM-dependent methyltransferase n=1 Tax=Arthrobacter sp. CAN_A1 TaxID=2787717 RepID=UPI0018CA972D
MPARPTEKVFPPGATDFERLAPALWNPMGNAVAAAADIALGDRVLDVYCGSGASTVPAAQSVGPEGLVDALDPSAELLDLARAKADAMSLTTIRFDTAPVSGWATDTPYDVVLCCYGLAHFSDLAAGTAGLAHQLRPGGRIALSTWDDGAHAGFRQLLQDACSTEAPGPGVPRFEQETANIDRLASAGKLGDWLLGNGFSTAGVDAIPIDVPLDRETAWSVVLGTVFRHLLPADPAAVERVRGQFVDRIGDGFVLDGRSLVAVAETAA